MANTIPFVHKSFWPQKNHKGSEFGIRYVNEGKVFLVTLASTEMLNLHGRKKGVHVQLMIQSWALTFRLKFRS